MIDVCNISDCEVVQGIRELKSRWTAVIIFELKNNKCSFTELKMRFSFLTETTLSRTLKANQASGIIKYDNGEYFLTNKGNEAHLLLKSIEKWQINNECIESDNIDGES